MSLTVYDDLEQGTDEWLEARRGIVTASEVGKLITPTLKIAENKTSNGLIERLAAERLSGRVDDHYMSRDMERGHLDEPFAREAYEQHMNVEVQQVGFMARKLDGFTLGYSPDGLVGEPGSIEIKSRKQQLQVMHVLEPDVPHDHMAQMQAGMLVADRAWCDYVSYSGGLHLSIHRIFADNDWKQQILEAVRRAEQEINRIVIDYQTYVEQTGLPHTEYVDHFGDDLELIL